MDKNPNTVYSFTTDQAGISESNTSESVFYDCVYDQIDLSSFSEFEPASSDKVDGSLIRGKLLPIFLYFIYPTTTIDVKKYL